MTVALCITAYLAAGLIFVKALTLVEPIIQEEEEDSPWSGVVLLTLLWPAGLLFVLVLAIKRFLLWDTKTWWTGRRARKLEQDLIKEVND